MEDSILLEIFFTKIKLNNIFGRYSYDNGNLTRLQNLWVFWSFFGPTLFALSLAATAFLEEINVVKLFQILPNFVILQFLLKLLCFYYKKDVFYQIEQKMLDFSRQYDFLEKHNHVVRKTFKKSMLVTSIYRGVVIVALIFIFLVPICVSHHELPYPGYFPYNTKTTLGYWMSYLFQLTTVPLPALINCTIDITHYKLVTVGCAVLKVLLKELNNINLKTGARQKEHFIRCVKFHVDVLELADHIEKFCTSVAFFQVVGSLCILAITSVEILVIPSDLVMGPIGFFMVMLLQTALYCWSANKFTDLSAELSTACYMSEWHSADLELQKMILIFMERVKRPIHLTAGKFAILNIALLTGILKTSYSYFAVLRNTYSK